MSSSALQWAPGYFNPMTDPDFRKACAHAINRAIYLKVVDGNVGVKADGPYKSNSKYYNASNGYPGYDKAQAVSHLNTYKANNPGKPVGFVLTTVQGSTASDQAFSWIAGALQAVGISVTQNPRNQVDLISDVINGTYDAAQWSQFGGTHPAQNYVWWNSQNLKDSPTAGGLGFWALPSSYATNGANALNIAGAVNFAHQANPDTENKMLDALTANYSTGADIPYWKGVAGNFGADVNYLWLDATVTAFAARTNVKNWNNALDGGMPGTKSKVVKGVTVTTPTMTYSKMLSTYGGSIRLDQAWMV
jgi:hypothetical protein